MVTFIHKYAESIFRVFLSLIFIVAGINHLLMTGNIVQKMTAAPLGALLANYLPPGFLIIGGGILLFIGGALLLMGKQTRWASLLLLALIIPITIIVQTQGLSTIGPFFKNIGLMGGLIYFAARGEEVRNETAKYQHYSKSKPLIQ